MSILIMMGLVVAFLLAVTVFALVVIAFTHLLSLLGIHMSIY